MYNTKVRCKAVFNRIHSPTASDGDILEMWEELSGSVNDFEAQEYHAGRDEIER